MAKKGATIPRGAVMLVPFPFTDLTAVKVRPAIAVSTNNDRGDDVVAIFISSNVPRKSFPQDIPVTEAGQLRAMGLKTPSVIKCRKIVTLDRAIILGELGITPPSIMKKIESNLKAVLGLSSNS